MYFETKNSAASNLWRLTAALGARRAAGEQRLKMKVRPNRPTANRPKGLSPGLLLWPKPKMEQRTMAAVQKPKTPARLGVVKGR